MNKKHIGIILMVVGAIAMIFQTLNLTINTKLRSSYESTGVGLWASGQFFPIASTMIKSQGHTMSTNQFMSHKLCFWMRILSINGLVQSSVLIILTALSIDSWVNQLCSVLDDEGLPHSYCDTHIAFNSVMLSCGAVAFLISVSYAVEAFRRS